MVGRGLHRRVGLRGGLGPLQALHLGRELDLDDLARTADGVAAGEVVAAVRDADTPIGAVRRGQWLGMRAGSAVAASDDVAEAVAAVVDAVVDDATELVTLVPGAGVDAAERAAIRADLERRHPHVEVEVVEGRQRPARWIVGAE